MRQKFIYSVLIIFIISFSSVMNANINTGNFKLPAWKNGLDKNALRQCQRDIDEYCRMDNIPKLQACIRTRLHANHQCLQNQAFYDETQGLIHSVKVVNRVNIIQATIFRADRSSGYYFIDSEGLLINPSPQVTFNPQQLKKLQAKNNQEVVVSADSLEKPLMEISQNYVTMTLRYPVTKGCLACQRLGIVTVGFHFSPRGIFRRHMITHLQHLQS